MQEVEKLSTVDLACPGANRVRDLCLLVFHIVVTSVERVSTSTDLFTNSIITNIYTSPPLWSSGQSSLLQIQRSGFDSRRYQIFREVVGLERSPLSLVNTIEELLGRKSSGTCLETENTAVMNRHADHMAPSISKSWH
jgi:hypothetical protein